MATPVAKSRQAGNGSGVRGLNEHLLGIYLNDHLGGSTTGLELVRRAAASNRGNEFGAFLSRLAEEIREDREALIETMERLGVRRDHLKVAGGWVIEKAGRLKLNGRLTGYSPLSRVMELEGLVMGVRAKLALWKVLKDVVGPDPRLTGLDFAAPASRASRQLEDLEDHRMRAAAIAFAGAEERQA